MPRKNTMTEPLSTVKVDESDGIHTITLNRPDRRNALNPKMIGELSEALDASERCACGAVILTGAGTAFCSGMDLEHLKSLNDQLPEDQRADIEAFMWLMRRLYEATKPTIAAVNGAALAGGTGLAMQCDFTLAAAGAKFGYTETRIGFIPAVVSVFLVRMVGEKRARDLLLSGRILPSEEALALGLLTGVTSEAELMPRSRALAATLMRNSPESMRETKKLLLSFSKDRLDVDLRRAMRWSERVRNQGDFREGLQAFLEKRDPVWPSRKQR
jgi:methylglutaconyl-CoA hydratase